MFCSQNWDIKLFIYCCIAKGYAEDSVVYFNWGSYGGRCWSEKTKRKMLTTFFLIPDQ